MSRRHVPNVNASLLHEIRMIAQTFLGHGQASQYAVRLTQGRTKTPKVSPMNCCFCVKVKVPATTVIGGFAVCDKHSYFMRVQHKDYQAYASRMS